MDTSDSEEYINSRGSYETDEEEDETPFTSNRELFYATYHRKQIWALPYYTINYMAKNPFLPKAYEKLIKSCKHFFIENPILFVGDVTINDQNRHSTTIFDLKDVNLQKIPIKIWITYLFYFDSILSLTSSVLPKIYRCYVHILVLWNEKISFNNFEFLTSKCKLIRLNSVTVIDENDSIVSLEKLFEALPNVYDFKYDLGNTPAEIITSMTASSLLKISKFTYFALLDVPEDFDIDSFFNSFIKKNKKTKVWLSFSRQISDAYNARLKTIVNEILETESHEYKVPFIRYPGMDESSYDKLQQLYDKN